MCLLIRPFSRPSGLSSHTFAWSRWWRSARAEGFAKLVGCFLDERRHSGAGAEAAMRALAAEPQGAGLRGAAASRPRISPHAMPMSGGMPQARYVFRFVESPRQNKDRGATTASPAKGSCQWCAARLIATVSSREGTSGSEPKCSISRSRVIGALSFSAAARAWPSSSKLSSVQYAGVPGCWRHD